jgi:hypothetical protein
MLALLPVLLLEGMRPSAAATLGPLALGSSYEHLVGTIGATPYTWQQRARTTGRDVTYASWEPLGLVVGQSEGRIISITYRRLYDIGGQAAAWLATIRSREGLAIGDPLARVRAVLGEPQHVWRQTLSSVEGLVPGTVTVDKMVYPLGELIVEVLDGRVTALGTYETAAFYGRNVEQLRRVVPGRALIGLELGEPLSGYLGKHRPPDVQRARPDGRGVDLLWFRPPDTIILRGGPGFAIDGIAVRSYQQTPGAVASDLRWLTTPDGLRLGDPEAVVRRTRGAPRRTERVTAAFRPAAEQAPISVELERWVYDGLAIDLREGRVWGFEVSAAPSATP